MLNHHTKAKQYGHKVWQYKDGEITEAGQEPEDGVLYTIALNRKNALKKWLRSGLLTILNDESNPKRQS